MHEHVWAELGKIDYLLDQLARAVERGEVHRSSYELLAPRYLERRTELVAVLESARIRVLDAQAASGAQPSVEPVSTPRPVPPPTPQAIPGASPASLAAPGASPASQTAPGVAPKSAPATRPAAPRRQRQPLSWTTVLVVTGAFLVIVASAIFALATWELFGPVFQFTFLSVLTAAFYAAGVLVRRRLGSSAGGVALITVASAMLLFDGWILISGFGLSGPWPWALWLLVCSAAYWFTELRLTGGIFGVAGAAAQIAWWWLLGEGLGWDSLPRLAGIAAVAALWAWASVRGRETPSTEPLARVLRYSAPATVAVAALVGLGVLAGSEMDLVAVLAVLVIGWAGTSVVEMLSHPRPLGAITHLPVLCAALGVIGAGAGEWSVSALLLVGALGAAAYDVARGSMLHGLLAPVLGAAAAASFGVTIEVSEVWRVVLIAIGASLWPVVGAVLRSERVALPAWLAGTASAPVSLHAGGIIVLGFASFALLPAIGTAPLLGAPWSVADTLAIGCLALAWALVAFGGRSGVGAAGLVVASFLLLAALLDLASPGWEAALLALPFLALALGWVLVREPIERHTGLPKELLLGGMRALTPAIVSVGLLADAVMLGDIHWSAGVLLWAAAAWWVADRVIDRQPFSLAPVAVFGAAGAAALGWWLGLPADAAIAAAAFALAGATLGLVMRTRGGMGGVFGWTLVATSSLLAVLASESGGSLALALGLTAAAGVIAVVSSGWREGAVVPVVLGTGAILAVLDAWSAGPWATVAVLSGTGFACLAPALTRTGERPHDTERLDRALAAAGLIPLGVGVMTGLFASTTLTAPAWAQLTGHHFAITLLLLGAYVLAASTRYRLEPGFYIGAGVLVLALFAELDAAGADWIELYSTPSALYLAWCGYRWASGGERRQVPLVSDIGATAVALGLPFLAMLDPWQPALDSWVHTFAVVGLALLAMTLGVTLRARSYFLGGVAALVLTALVRSWDVLVLWWWLVLGLVGTGMIVIALARELRQAMASGVRDLMAGWR